MLGIMAWFLIIILSLAGIVVYLYQKSQHPLSDAVRLKVVLSMVSALLLLSTLSYALWGSFGGWYQKERWSAQGFLLTQIQEASTKEKLQRLQKRISASPEDKLAWQALINQLSAMGQFELVLKAIERYESIHGSEDFLGLKTQSLYLQTGKINDKVEKLFTVLTARPQESYLIDMIKGIDFYKKNRRAKALYHWRQALEQVPQNHPDRQTIVAAITEAEGRKEKNNKNELGIEIKVHVGISETLKEKLADTRWYLWVIAKEKNGNPAPLAVHRAPLSSLPATVVLTDQMAMMAGHSLKQGQEILLSARITRHQQVSIQSGDIYAEPMALELSERKMSQELILTKEK